MTAHALLPPSLPPLLPPPIRTHGATARLPPSVRNMVVLSRHGTFFRRSSSSGTRKQCAKLALIIIFLLFVLTATRAVKRTATLLLTIFEESSVPSHSSRRLSARYSRDSSGGGAGTKSTTTTNNTNNRREHHDGSSGLRIAVCVTGQIGRLELGSKAQNLLKSLDRQADFVDLYVSLEEGAVHYNNVPKFKSVCGTDIETMRDAFRPWLRMTREQSDDDSFPINTNLPIYQQKWWNFTRDIIDHRTKNNIRQFRHSRWCAQAMQEREIRLGFHYHGFVRIRDNSIVLKPFRFPTALLRSTLPMVAVRKCMSWGGYNDKTIIGNRLAFDAALRGSSEGYYLSPMVQRNHSLRNPEQLTKAVLDEAGVQAILDNEMLPFVDSRCGGRGGTPCLSQQWKDCHVSRPWYWRIRVCNNTEMARKTMCPPRCSNKVGVV